jgi:hypothetical protein
MEQLSSKPGVSLFFGMRISASFLNLKCVFGDTWMARHGIAMAGRG